MSNEPNKTGTSRAAAALKSLLRGRNILADRRVRLVLAVALAVLAWMAVTMIVQPNTTTTIANVPVNYEYDTATFTSRGLSVVSAPEKTVTLRVSGDGYTIGGLTANDFVVYPDWSSVRDSGEKTLRLRVRTANSNIGTVAVSIEGDDTTVTVVFDVVQERTLPVEVKTNYLQVADGYILYDTAPSKEQITISGPSGELEQVASCTAEVVYNSPLTETVTVSTGLRFYTESGKEVHFQYATVEQDDVDVTIQVYKTATLPVSVSFINTPRGFDSSVLVYSLSQKNLKVAGPESVINTLSTLSVGSIDLSTFALDKVYELPIELPENIHLLDNVSTVTVSFDCSQMATKTLNLPSSCVQVLNLPSTYQLTVETERLMNVTLCGPKAALETLAPEQVVIEIDAEDFSVALGQQNIACRLYVPSNGKIFALGSYVLPCRIESN